MALPRVAKKRPREEPASSSVEQKEEVHQQDQEEEERDQDLLPPTHAPPVGAPPMKPVDVPDPENDVDAASVNSTSLPDTGRAVTVFRKWYQIGTAKLDDIKIPENNATLSEYMTCLRLLKRSGAFICEVRWRLLYSTRKRITKGEAAPYERNVVATLNKQLRLWYVACLHALRALVQRTLRWCRQEHACLGVCVPKQTDWLRCSKQIQATLDDRLAGAILPLALQTVESRL